MIEQLPLPIKEMLKRKNIDKLRPAQEIAIKKGIFKGKNIVVSSPTGSGKTLIAEFAMINHFLKKGKILYIAPLKSLATEKYKNFKKKYEEFGLKTTLTIGDYDKNDRNLSNFDVIISTSEKVDSLIRHNSNFIKQLTCIIIDEIHLLDDVSRGPTLEIVIITLKELIKKIQIIALSATIQNDDELADWLDAKLVKNNFRPVKLYEGVFLDDTIYFKDKNKKIPFIKSNEETILNDTLKLNKQIIFFLSSRRNAVGLAKRLNLIKENKLNEKEKSKLEIISKNILNSLEQPTSQCKLLSMLVKNGIVFHHAGLIQKQKEIIEQAFRDKLIKCICATPTLAAGINLPAFRVVVRDLMRYSPTMGMYYLPVLEVKQMFGRAGRPGMEDYGEAIAIAKTIKNKDEIVEKYINGSVEEITSKLGVEVALRSHVLSLIANDFCRNKEELLNFFKKSFFAKQYKNMTGVINIINNIISDLIKFEFIVEKNKNLFSTKIGRRINQLYLDPLAANSIITNIIKNKTDNYNDFSIIQAICFSGAIRTLRINNKEIPEIIMESSEYKLLMTDLNPFDYEYENYIKSLKTALFFIDWINETNEQTLFEKFKVFPGDIRNYNYYIDWLLYGVSELSRLFKKTKIKRLADNLRLRIKYGIKEELIPLVSIKGIGRVRARKLYNNKIKNKKDINNITQEKLAEIIGKAMAKRLKEI